MSNCIDFQDGYGTLAIPGNRIDLAKLEGLVAEVRDLANPPESGPEAIAWWFMSHAEFRDDMVLIELGQGRSSHTWRDFQGLLMVLSNFMTSIWDVTFRLTDEYDGFQKVSKVKVHLAPGSFKVS